MALSDVLSALRIVILDDFGKVPEDIHDRRILFTQKFPNLTKEELEDFIAIPSDRFGLYTGTIFSGQRSVLRNHFPVTFAVLKNAHEKNINKKFDAYDFVKNIHQTYPWKTNETSSLANNLISYITNNCADITSIYPYLPEIPLLEKLSLELKRLNENVFTNFESYSIDELNNLTVESLLEIKIFRPETTKLTKFEYEILPIYHKYHNSRELNEGELSSIKQSTNFAIGNRREDLAIRWIPINYEIFKLLSSIEHNESFSMSKFAEVFVDSSPQIDNEEEMFRNLFSFFTSLHGIGALVALRNTTVA